jgi:lambda repressor-like predicted transcriptional regulator
MRRGWGAAAVARFLRGQGCSLDELTAYTGLTPSRVRHILNNPCAGKRELTRGEKWDN